MSPARFRLRELIEERQISQSELSRRSGVSFATINRMCQNSTAQVSLDTLDRLSRALAVDLGELLESKPEPRKPRTRRSE